MAWPSVLLILFILSFTRNSWLEVKQMENHNGFAELGGLGELYLLALDMRTQWELRMLIRVGGFGL